MKTLREYILEAMKQEEFLQKIHDIYNDDYDEVFKVLSKHDPNTLKEKQEKLRGLFEKRGLSLNNRNELIIKNICRVFNKNTIDDFIKLCVEQEQNIKKFNIEGNEIEKVEIYELLNNNSENENLTKLIKSLIDIKDFKKPNNNSGIGKFELLFILLYGKPIDVNSKDSNLIGDLHLSNGVTVEIKAIDSNDEKSKAPLASNVGDKSIEELSKTFLKNIFEKEKDKKRIVNIFKDKKEQKNFDIIIKNFVQNNITNSRVRTSDQPRCLANETAYINIMTILNTFFNGKIKQSEEKDLCETIFKSYINVLLSQFISERDKKQKFNLEAETNKVFEYFVQKQQNPFYIADIDIDKYKDKEKNELSEIFKDKDKDKNKDKPKKFIYCKKLTQITGAIHLYGYALSKCFNHILICDESSLECICIKNVNKVETIENVLTHVIFLPADAVASSGRHNNISKIKKIL